MKNVLFMIILLCVVSCKEQISAQEKNSSNNIVNVQNNQQNVEYDTINHFLGKSLVSLDSLNLEIKRELLRKNSEILEIELDKSDLVNNRYNLYVTNLLLLPQKVLKGSQYTVHKDGFMVVDLYYSSKKDIDSVLLNIKNILDDKNNHNETFVSYFKPCGLYLLINNSEILVLQNKYCIKNNIMNQPSIIKSYDAIYFIETKYDINKNKEMSELIKIK